MANRSFWSQQRVLLTGHTGFKGSWLGVWLAQLGADVYGLSLAPATDPALFDLLEPSPFAGSVIGDIRDRSAIADAVANAKPTVVIHMAAQALVLRGYRAPIQTFETNMMGTANLLDALRGLPALSTVLVVTTDKVYRNSEDGHAFREDDPLGAHDPYSASKAAAEIAVSSWAQSFFSQSPTRIVTARAGNVIGGGDWSEDRLIPDVWRAIRAKQQVVLRHPRATRPWQHVIEPLAGYLRYAEAAAGDTELPKALNFGPYPEDVLTVAELTEAMLAAAQAPAAWQEDTASPTSEMQTLALDPTLACEAIGWRPRLSSREAIAWTAEWYGRLAQGEDARSLCLEQISRYETLQ